MASNTMKKILKTNIDRYGYFTNDIVYFSNVKNFRVDIKNHTKIALESINVMYGNTRLL